MSAPTVRKLTLLAPIVLLFAVPAPAQIENGNFESGDFKGWIADPTWVIAKDSREYYSGWEGGCWAWSGGKGEAATGKLRSKPFTLDKDGVRLSIAGWNSLHGSGMPRKWNYVTLNLADGTELDRVYAPNGVAFVPVMLSGMGHRGKIVYLEAVDDADQDTYSMLCIDDVKTVADPLLLPLPALAETDEKATIVLEDDRYRVEIGRANGVVTRILDKKGGLELIREPRLADNFHFTLPLPGKEPLDALEANDIEGREQKLSSFELDGKKLALRWNGPLTNYLGEKFDVSAVMRVKLTDAGVSFKLTLDNATPYRIGEVFFPRIGGVQGLGKSGSQLKATELVRPSGDAAVRADIFRVFTNVSSFGNRGPEQFYTYPKGGEAWMEFHAPGAGRSVYFGVHDLARRAVTLHLELSPDNSATVREDGNWPRPNELRDLPVGLSASFVDFADAPAGKPYEAPAVLISFHDGGWSEAKRIFERWDKSKQ